MIEQHVFILNSLAFPKIMRGFFGPIIKFLYYSIAKLVDFMYDLADGNLGLNSQIVDEFSDKFFLILIIFMIFKLTFSLINYLVDPAAFSDNKKGFSNIIKRIIISVALLVSINPIFSLLGDIQKTIISEDIISNYILYTSNDKVSYYQIGDKKYYATKMDPNCDEQRYIFSNSIGDRFSVLALRPFYQLTPLDEVDDVTEQKEFIEGSDYCGASVDVFGQLSTSEEMAIQKINATLKNTKTSASELLTASIYNGMSGDWDPTHDETFYVNFNYFWALIVGTVVCLFIITICFDVVIRALSLFFYQIIAPLPIIMYVSPNGKESEMLSKWFKSTVSVWVSLFIKIAALSLGLYFCGLLCDSLNNDSYGLIKQIVVIIGTLMFAKKFPKLLEELIPGLKLGGMELNPFKRIRKDALGGDLLMNSIGRGVGLLSGGVGGIFAGFKAGKEIGSSGKGSMLGFMSGASHGFRNKKWSLGTGMNESYKNLTGNEFRRLTPTSLILSKMGEQPVQEAKGYIKTAYSQLNKYNSDLNILENISSSLAQDLMSKGYNVNNISNMKNAVSKKINDQNRTKNELILKSKSLENEKDASETNYNNLLNKYNSVKSEYDSSLSSLENIKQQILDEERKLSNNSIIGASSVYQNKINALKNQQLTLEKTVSAKKREMENIDLTKAKDEMNEKIEIYNNNNLEIQKIEQSIRECKLDAEKIQKFEDNIKQEEQIREKISSVDKDINTLKKEKSQRERFYRIDPAPQQDYSDAKKHVDERKNS